MLRVTAIAGLVLATATALATPARASGQTIVCPPGGTVCYIVIDAPSQPGVQPVSGGGNTAPVCHEQYSNVAVPCYDATFGWWSNAGGCYYSRLSPPPPATDPVWNGQYPNGAIYQSTCPGVLGSGGGWVWKPTAPPGFGGGPGTAAQLAAEAVARLQLSGPDIGFAPDPGKVGLVGLPVWMWTRVSRATWGPTSATAALPGLSVTATARAKKIVWDMGDGHEVTCDGPGTPYAQGSGQTTSPTCGYAYSVSSANQAGHAFTVTATTTWAISWQGSGGSGQTAQTRTSSVQARIGELQVLVS